MSSSRSLLRDVVHGALGFALVSIAAFSVWAFAGKWFHGHGGELAMYGAIAAVFVGLAGVVLSRLAGGMGRFYRAFLPSFLVYSAVWTLAWMKLGGRAGEWAGAGLGSLAFAWISLRLLGKRGGWLAPAICFFILHTAGYFAGDWAMYGYWLHPARLAEFPHLTKPTLAILAKLSWGLCYGLGFGAGLGWVYHQGRRLPLEPAAN